MQLLVREGDFKCLFLCEQMPSTERIPATQRYQGQSGIGFLMPGHYCMLLMVRCFTLIEAFQASQRVHKLKWLKQLLLYERIF